MLNVISCIVRWLVFVDLTGNIAKNATYSRSSCRNQTYASANLVQYSQPLSYKVSQTAPSGGTLVIGSYA